MPAKVLLTALKGPLEGTKYRFDEPMLCMVGRSESCMLRLIDEAGDGVSRHHCLLDIKPPKATICDLGSRNGTFLNREKLPQSQTRELATGNIIRIGYNAFEITLIPARKCRICGGEMPDLPPGSESRTSRLVCDNCIRGGKENYAAPAAKTVLFQTCSVCGQRIASSQESGQVWHEDCNSFICADCLNNHNDMSKTFRMPEMEIRRGQNVLQIKNYRVIKLIGRGGLGAVYLAENINTLERVALKILLPEIAVQDQCRDDFMREAENLRGLKHPNIVELKDCDYTGGALFLALDYCPEGSLREYMIRTGMTLKLNTALDLTCQILDGLEYAHNVRMEQMSLLDAQMYMVNGLVHRDIKPANIFLTRQADGSLAAKISDFGLAKAFDMAGISGCTRTGDFSGTLGFIPKQQYLNYKYVKPEVDVWATAATLYYMLTGKTPRNFSNPTDINRIFENPPSPLWDYNPYVPKVITSVIDAALDDRQTFRFKSADQLKFALQEARNKI